MCSSRIPDQRNRYDLQRTKTTYRNADRASSCSFASSMRKRKQHLQERNH